MNERTSRKIPVTERQFLWVQDDDKGEVTLHVGPTMVSPTAADRVVIDDGQGGFREDPSARPQMMVEVGDNQYSVLYNPLVENEAGPNGKFKLFADLEANHSEIRPATPGFSVIADVFNKAVSDIDADIAANNGYGFK